MSDSNMVFALVLQQGTRSIPNRGLAQSAPNQGQHARLHCTTSATHHPGHAPACAGQHDETIDINGGRKDNQDDLSGCHVQGVATCSAALKMQKGMSARSLNLLKSGSFTTCCSLSQPISTSGSLSSILCKNKASQFRPHISQAVMGAGGNMPCELISMHIHRICPAHQRSCAIS